MPSDAVRVWYQFTERIQEPQLTALAATLSDHERERAQRFKFVRDRRDYIAAHALLRRSLTACAGRPAAEWKFETPDSGKPAIAADQANGIEFNLSHTHGLVACAVCREPVGVDVESIDRLQAERDIAERFFSPDECRMLDRLAPAAYTARFIELWTLKEAYLKGVGVGLAHPLDTFSFDLDGAQVAFSAPPGVRTDAWQFQLVSPSPRYRLAVAVEHAGPNQPCRIAIVEDRAG